MHPASAIESMGSTRERPIVFPKGRDRIRRYPASLARDSCLLIPCLNQCDLLGPADASALECALAELEKHAKRRRIAIVGHEPGVGDLGAKLAGMREDMEFKKGAVCRIDVEALPPKGPGVIRWFITPKLLRNLKK